MRGAVRLAAWRVLAAGLAFGLASCSLPMRRPVAQPPTQALPPPFVAPPPVAMLPAPLPRPAPLPPPPVFIPPPVSPALAARFPEPALTIPTPAFEPGRTAFTTNDELRSILHGLQRSGVDPAHGSQIAVLPLGTSQAGEPIEALAVTRVPPPALTASAVARRPAVVLIAGQHGDEPAGTEALIVVAQDLAKGKLDRVLDQLDIFVLPRANPDGAARGERGAADGVDVNRDHVLLRTPEALAQAQLMRDVAPVVVLDLHEYAVDAGFQAKFGGVQRFDALFDTASVVNLRPFVARAAEEWFREPLAAALGAAGFSNEWYYTIAADPADRKLSMGSVDPSIGRNANGLRNAVSLLVETRGRGIGRVDLKRRIQADLVAIGSVLGNATTHAADLVKLRDFVDRDVVSLACRGEAAIEAAPTPSEHALVMLDASTGAIRRVTVAWDSTLELRVVKTRPRPCGYWLAASESDAVRRLRGLGIEVQQLDEAGEVRGETYREIGRDATAAPAGGPTRLRVQTQPVLLDVAAGGYFVSLEQPLANLAIVALEPESPVGFAANGVIGSVAQEARVLARPQMRMAGVP